jgi:hypothetical protein
MLNSRGLKYSYQVDTVNLKYDYSVFKAGGGKAAIDSGTTFVYMSFELYSILKIQWATFCRSGDDQCAHMSDFQNCYAFDVNSFSDIQMFFSTFPPIVFVFNDNIEITWHPREYFYFDDDQVSYCIGIQPLKDLILGSIFMKNYDIQFDLTNQKVGFTNADCNRQRSAVNSTAVIYPSSNFNKPQRLKLQKATVRALLT